MMRKFTWLFTWVCLMYPQTGYSNTPTFTRPITLVVPFAPGGTTDLTARVLAQELSTRLPQPVRVENRPGAFAIVGTRHVLSQPADGHTWLIAANGITAHTHFSTSPDAQVFTHITPITLLVENAMALMVSNHVPVSSAEQLLAQIRAQPGVFNYATIGGGGVVSMAAHMFLNTTQTQMQAVPYTGGAPAMTDLQAGRIHIMFDSTIVGLRNDRSGTARALAVTGESRHPQAPHVPTLQELGVPMTMMTWQGIFVHDQTDLSLQHEINRMITSVINNPQVRARFLELGADTVLGTSVEQSRTRVQQDILMWNQVFNPG